MDKKKLIILSVLFIFVLSMTISSINASKIVKLGKYKCKLSNNDIKKVKKGKQVDKKTGKYVKYKYAGKITKNPVYISICKYASDGSVKKGKYYIESWSSDGPINCKWIKL
jgi:hypothetical protein